MITKTAIFKDLLKSLPHIVWGSFLALCLLSGCMKDDEYSTSASDRLSFSTDTVNLDTIISGQATNTYTFEVYNHNKKAIRISSVYLKNGANSDFHVNVDGVYLEGGSASDIEIGAEDSIRVFLMANATVYDSDDPVKTQDKLVFVTEGGAQQEVTLIAYGQDVIPLNAITLTNDTTLSAQRPYLVYDSLVVAEGVTLTVKAGVKFYFHPDANLIVHGTLIANGTTNNNVMMRGDRLGYMFSQQPYDRIPGQWGGVIFTSESYGNHLNYCDIHSGTFGIQCDSSDTGLDKLTLENSVVHNVSGDALSAKSSKVFVGNSQITNAGGNCVTLLGGDNTFVHCTIANFYAFSTGRGVALYYSNEDGSSRLPLENATFMNCLITGYSTDEIVGSQSTSHTSDAFNYLFQNCLLDTPEVEGDLIQNCLWDNDDHEVYREGNFSPEFDLDQLIFTFGLDARSQAVNSADASIANSYYPYDLNGRSRLSDDGPDIGCYEYIEE